MRLLACSESPRHEPSRDRRLSVAPVGNIQTSPFSSPGCCTAMHPMRLLLLCGTFPDRSMRNDCNVTKIKPFGGFCGARYLDVGGDNYCAKMNENYSNLGFNFTFFLDIKIM
jgi:hypothetical protein